MQIQALYSKEVRNVDFVIINSHTQKNKNSFSKGLAYYIRLRSFLTLLMLRKFFKHFFKIKYYIHLENQKIYIFLQNINF